MTDKDRVLMEWEQARGTMPADDQIGTEYGTDRPPQVDPVAMQRVRDAYRRSLPKPTKVPA